MKESMSKHINLFALGFSIVGTISAAFIEKDTSEAIAWLAVLLYSIILNRKK